MDAIILAGGKGTRMGEEVPKPLTLVCGKTILDHQLENLLSFSLVEKIILSIGHRAQEIQEYVEGRYPDRDIIFSIEERPLGTGGGLKLAMQKATSARVLVLNGDDITDLPIDALEPLSEHTICVAHPRLPFGRVLERDGYAVFEEKPMLPDWISCGWYCFNREELLCMLPDEGSLEYDVFPKTKLRIYYHEGMWRPLNSKKDIQAFEEGVEPGK
ncbi:MAG: NTP transferase domain-containing protein [Candidatus Uhrbacteria bacterium]|nr:NTP transferase domain-containing protein [Candidatus Uhrbacteria bacterium]